MTLEVVLMWVALTGYVAATAAFVFGVTLGRETVIHRGVLLTVAGAAAQISALAVRWARLGHGPYIGYYEVANALTLCTVGLFVAAALRNRRMSATGIGIMPVAVLLLGGSMLASRADFPITSSLASYWLFIHVTFANLAFAAFAACFGFAVVYLIRDGSGSGRWAHRLAGMPDQEVIENTGVRLALAGFLLWGIMIATGAIWANESWGRYWSWDPIETWSLVVWMIYAVYLHARFVLRWRAARLAWFAILAMPVALFCLVGIPTVFRTIHAGYVGGVEGLMK